MELVGVLDPDILISPDQNEAVAHRIAELIQLAYKAGREDVQNEIKKALGLE